MLAHLLSDRASGGNLAGLPAQIAESRQAASQPTATTGTNDANSQKPPATANRRAVRPFWQLSRFQI